MDYPALPCPAQALTGCYYAISDMQTTASSYANGFFTSNTIVHILLAVMAAYLGFPKKKKNRDEESAVSNSNSNSNSNSDSVEE